MLSLYFIAAFLISYVTCHGNSTVAPVKYACPLVRLVSNKTITSEGRDAIITCRIIRGFPQPTMRWHFQKENTTRWLLLNESDESLIIRNVSLDNSGRYRCNASTVVVGVRRGHSWKIAELVVTKVPEVSIPGGSEVLIKYGSSYELNCKVIAHPSPRIVWKDQFGNDISRPEVTVNGHEYTSSFKLTNIRYNTKYYCLAENDVGRTSSPLVSVSAKSPFTITSKLEEKTKVKYKMPVKLDCGIKSHLPIEGVWLSDKEKELSLRGISMAGNNVGEFALKSMDIDLQGRYGCKVWLISDPEVYTEQYTTLEIDDLYEATSKESLNDDQLLPLIKKVGLFPFYSYLKSARSNSSQKYVFSKYF